MASVKKVEIKPIETGPADSQFALTLYDAAKVILVSMIPPEESDEAGQDSEPFLAVHPDQQFLVGAAYTKLGANPAPLYLSTDGGWSWTLKSLVPFEVSGQTYCFSGTGKKLYGAISAGPDYEVLVLETNNPIVAKRMRMISPKLRSGLADQPFIQACAFNQDRIYVGQNYFGPELGGHQTASVRVSTDGGKTFRLLGLDARPNKFQDAPSVRPSVAKNGTAYVAFIRWTASSGNFGTSRYMLKGDVVVTRDDEGGIGVTPFRSLLDPSDGKPGRIVARNRVFPFGAKLGQQ